MRRLMIRSCLWSKTWQPIKRDPAKDKWRPEAELSRLKAAPIVSHGVNPKYEAEYARWFAGNLDEPIEWLTMRDPEKPPIQAPMGACGSEAGAAEPVAGRPGAPESSPQTGRSRPMPPV